MAGRQDEDDQRAVGRHVDEQAEPLAAKQAEIDRLRGQVQAAREIMRAVERGIVYERRSQSDYRCEYCHRTSYDARYLEHADYCVVTRLRAWMASLDPEPEPEPVKSIFDDPNWGIRPKPKS